MFKYIFVFTILFFSVNIYAKEYRSIFGFTANIPNTFIVITSLNHADSINRLEERGYDSSVLLELLEDIKYKKNLETIVDISGHESESFNFNEVENESIINDSYLKELCPYVPELFADMAKKYVHQYSCKMIKIKNLPSDVVYMLHDSLYSEDNLMIQYQFYLKEKQYLTFSGECLKKNCKEIQKIMEQILLSIRM